MNIDDLQEAWQVVRRRVRLRQLDNGDWVFYPGCFGRFLKLPEAVWLVEMERLYGSED